MGAPWVKWNRWTERYEFLHMVTKTRNEMERSWALYQESSQESERPDASKKGDEVMHGDKV
eukprot:5886074-Alexandrium_andersonii.AAC.1